MNVHHEKIAKERKGKPELKFYAALGTIFGISTCFQRSKQKLHTHVQKVLNYLYRSSKNII
jgi:hypothetical protein